MFELQALDFVVSEANKYKIRLILSLANNWDAYGGKAQYVKWGKASGLNLTSDDDFFSHPTLRSYYKAHVKATFRPLLQPTFFFVQSNIEFRRLIHLTVGLTVSLFTECRRY